MTQWTVAEIAELDRKHISMIETSQAEPRVGTLIRIAGALDVPVERLVAGIVFVPSEDSTGVIWRCGPPDRTHRRTDPATPRLLALKHR